MNSNNNMSMVIKDQFYTIKSTLTEGIWNIMLTNLDDLFIEKLTRPEIIERFEKLNPLLSIEDIDVDEIICELFSNIPKYAVGTPSTNEIKLQSVIEGGTFKFAIHLNLADSQKFRREVMKPMKLYAIELTQKLHDLIEEMRRKDEEILEYKANGGKLIRRHIETKVFDIKSWVSDTFQQYGDWLSLYQPVLHNQKVESGKNIKIVSNSDQTMMNELKMNTEYSPSKLIESEHMKRREINSSNDSIKHKKRKILDVNL